MPKAQADATAAGLSRIPRLASQPSPGFTTARRRVQRCCTGHATAAFGVRRDKAALSSGCKADSLQPEAIGAVMEVTKWLKPSNSGHDLVTARVCRPQRE